MSVMVYEALLAVGISGVVIGGYFKLAGDQHRVKMKVEATSNNEALRAFIRESLDCDRTFAALDVRQCGRPGVYHRALDVKGDTLIGADGKTLFGDFRVRISCPVSADRLLVEAIRVKHHEKTEDAIHHTTRKPEVWEDLFRGIPVYSRLFETSVLNFERTGIASDTPVTDQFYASHGVRFRAGSGIATLNRVMREGESASTAREERAWRCGPAYCDGGPHLNRVADAATERIVGYHALSTSEATHDRDAALIIEYRQPVTKLSFDMIDADHGEEWRIVIRDADGNALSGLGRAGGVAREAFDEAGYEITAARGAGADSDNGRVTPIEIMRPAGGISRVELVGRKRGSYFGYGFDNFKTGIGACAKRN